jgi:hypothetical protein
LSGARRLRAVLRAARAPQLDLDALLTDPDHRRESAPAALRLRGAQRAELPVLVRWFEGIEPPVADYLVPILYAVRNWRRRARRSTPTGASSAASTPDARRDPDGAPITMMRNALGVAEGGSAWPLDRAAHARSVEFWRTHANWR